MKNLVNEYYEFEDEFDNSYNYMLTREHKSRNSHKVRKMHDY